MPTSFRTLVSTKGEATKPGETNLERGRIWSFIPSGNMNPLCFCWCPPSAGVAVIEVWGAGGSGGHGACCGYSIPGNAGAYTKKTICFSQKQSCCTFICGRTDHACRENRGCFKGCSKPGQVCWRVGNQTHNDVSTFENNQPCHGCMCAQGGRGALGICSTGESFWCCTQCQRIAGTKLQNENCGLACNIYRDDCWYACGSQCRTTYERGTGDWDVGLEYATCWGSACCVSCCCGMVTASNAGPQWNWAKSYGGDVCCCGHFSCSAYFMCNSNDNCCMMQYLATPAGQYARDGAVLIFNPERNSEYANGGGGSGHNHSAAIGAVSRSPGQYIPWSYCWGFGGGCGCYGDANCHSYTPPGHPSHASTFCENLNDAGMQGGPSAVKIKFITS